eukprot:491472-Pyramimonas_sp.AAC.1
MPLLHSGPSGKSETTMTPFPGLVELVAGRESSNEGRGGRTSGGTRGPRSPASATPLLGLHGAQGRT